MMKRIKKISLILLSLLTLVVVSATVIATLYEDEIKQFALEKIDESLVTEMTVTAMDFTLWDQFPQASVVFKNVLIEETFSSKDTLLYADEVFLQFDVWDMIGGSYKVKNVTVKEAQLNIKRLENGDDNFHFWKESTESNDDFTFELEGVELLRVATSIEDKSAKFSLLADAEKVSLNGAFENQAIYLESIADLQIHNISVGKEVYISKKHVLADLNMEINQADAAYYIRSGDFNLEGIDFSATGSIMEQASGMLCDLKIHAEENDIADVLKHLPPTYKDAITEYRAKGIIKFDGEISGLAGDGSQPDVSFQYSIEGAQFVHHKSGVSMSDILTNGQFEKVYGRDEKLSINNFEADFESGSFKVTGVVSNFKSPHLNMGLVGNFDLQDLKKFIGMAAIEDLQGNFVLNAKFEGSIQNPKQISKRDLNNSKVSGQIEFSDAMFKLKTAAHAFEKLEGKFTLDNKHASIEKLQGKVEESQFTLVGNFENFLPYLLIKEEVLNIDAAFSSTGVNFNSLLAENESSDDYNLGFPPDVNFDLILNLDEVRFRDFVATKIRGKATMTDQIVVLHPISFQTAEGDFSANGKINGQASKLFDVDCKAQLSAINITRFFEEFENFGQDFIQAKHLKGTATAVVDFKAKFDSSLDFDPDKIVSTVDISIQNGELIDLKSMRNISNYVRDNHFIAPFVDEDALDEKLNHIYFATLENEIEIRNSQIHIPKMEIVTSAMSISASGTHTFSNDIDYTLGFKIRDILSKDQQTEFGKIEDDGLSNSFFLSMQGTSDDPEFGYDRLAHKEKRKADRQAEKEQIKSLLKDELGRGKNDKTAEKTSHSSQEQNTAVSITLVDENGKTAAKDDKKAKKKRKGWLKADDKEDVKISFEDDDDDDF